MNVLRFAPVLLASLVAASGCTDKTYGGYPPGSLDLAGLDLTLPPPPDQAGLVTVDLGGVTPDLALYIAVDGGLPMDPGGPTVTLLAPTPQAVLGGGTITVTARIVPGANAYVDSNGVQATIPGTAHVAKLAVTKTANTYSGILDVSDSTCRTSRRGWCGSWWSRWTTWRARAPPRCSSRTTPAPAYSSSTRRPRPTAARPTWTWR
jgi:hypothetical protein